MTLPAAARTAAAVFADDHPFRRSVADLPGGTFEADVAACLLRHVDSGVADAGGDPLALAPLAADYAAHYGDPADVIEVPVDLAALTPAAPARLDGRSVVAVFVAAVPAYTVGGRTVAGAGDFADGVERGAVFAGVEDVGRGERLTVRGELRVIRHAGWPGTPAWVELRVDAAERGRR